MCTRMIVKGPAPDARAASTKSMFRTPVVTLSATRVICGTNTTVRETMRLRMAEATNHRSRIRIGEPKPRRAQGGKKNRDQNAGADHADLVAYDAAADSRPVTARLGGGLCLEGRVRLCTHGGDTHLLQLRLIRGSIAACAISTMRFKNTKNSASTRIVPCSNGRSR